MTQDEGRIAPEQARAYMARMERMNARDIEALRAMSVEEKFHQCAALMAAGKALEPDPRREAENEAVRAAWRRLREIYGRE